MYFYHGFSMRGTFRPGDCLFVEPATLLTLRPGDIAIYQKSDDDHDQETVVHRVIKVVPGGIITQGDSNLTSDVEIVLETAIIGQVTQYERRGTVHRVRGGLWGRLRGQLLRRWYWRHRHLKFLILELVFALGRPFYRKLRKSGVITRLWNPTITKVHFETDDGPIVKYVANNRTVGLWWPKTNQIWCRRPYDLVLADLLAKSSDDTPHAQPLQSNE